MSNMTKLEPCPFCGGEVEWVSGAIKCHSCSVSMDGWRRFKRTIERWNRRYKRTCNFFPSFDRDIWGEESAKHMLEEYLASSQPATLSTMDLPDCYECSACAWQVKQEPPAWMKHCANCGAEVIDDD